VEEKGFSSDFSGMSAEEDYINDAVESATPPPEKAPEASAPPVVQPAALPETLATSLGSSVPPPASTELTQPASETKVEQQVTEPASAVDAPPQSIGDLLKMFQENGPALVDALAQNQFALSREEQDALELDAMTSIPKLMARSYVQTMSGVMNLIQNMVPQMIMSTVNDQARLQRAEDMFFGAFPQLDKRKHGEAISTIGAALRRQDPQASFEELVPKIGQAVMAMYALQPSPSQPTAPAGTRAQPFVPTLPAARVIQQAPVVDGNNFFEGMARDYDD
jgi:hypothetical protein